MEGRVAGLEATRDHLAAEVGACFKLPSPSHNLIACQPLRGDSSRRFVEIKRCGRIRLWWRLSLTLTNSQFKRYQVFRLIWGPSSMNAEGFSRLGLRVAFMRKPALAVHSYSTRLKEWNLVHLLPVSIISPRKLEPRILFLWGLHLLNLQLL